MEQQQVVCETKTYAAVATNNVQKVSHCQDHSAGAAMNASTPRVNYAGGIDFFADVGTKSAKRTNPHFFIGKSASSGILVVAVIRQLNYFVSRLGVDTHPDQLKNSITEKISDGVQIACEKLKTKFESYASFHVDFI